MRARPNRSARWYRRWVLFWFPSDFPKEELEEAALLYSEGVAHAAFEGRMSALRYAVRAFAAAAMDGFAERAIGMRSGSLAEFGSDLSRDVRLGVRRLIRSPGHWIVATVSLGVGIGFSSMLFSVVNAILLTPLEVPNPEGIVRIFTPAGRETLASSLSLDVVEALDADVATLEGVAGAARFTTAAELLGAARVVSGELVTPGYLEVLGLRPALGRGFTPADGLQGGPRVAILSHDYWRTAFDDGSSAVGSTIRLSQEAFSVIGVMPRGFGGLNFSNDVDVWITLAGEGAIGTSVAVDRTNPALSTVARLAGGATIADAEREVRQAIRRRDVGGASIRAEGEYFVLPERAGLINPAMPQLVTIASLVSILGCVLLLLVACGNVAGLALARSAALVDEFRVRMALGARGMRLFRQLVVEGAILVLPAALVGIAITATSGTVYSFLLPFLAETDIEFVIDRRMLIYTTVSAVLALLIAGALPAAFAARESGARGPSSNRGSAKSASRVMRRLVIGEITFAAIVLVIGSAFVQTASWYDEADPGFGTQGRVAVSIDVGLGGLEESRGRQFFRDLVGGLSAGPYTEHVALAGGLTRVTQSMEVAERPGEPVHLTESNVVGPGYFDVLSIPVLQGRSFGPEDEGGRAVVVVNETLARQLWGEEPPLSRLINIGRSQKEVEVVGVVADITSGSPLAGVKPMVYTAFDQDYRERMLVILESTTDRAVVTEEVRRAVQGLAPGLPILRSITVDEAVNADRILARAAATMGVALGMTALFLAGVGVFGMLAFSVRMRRGELSVRKALGATSRDIFTRVLWGGLAIGVVGAAIGLPIGIALSFGVRNLAIGSQPLNPITLAAVAGVVFLIVLAAVWLPAIRAARLDPGPELSRG